MQKDDNIIFWWRRFRRRRYAKRQFPKDGVGEAKKKICVFPVTRPTLIFSSDPKVFIGIPKK